MKAHISMNTVNICGKEYEMFASTAAVSEITKLCGGLSKLTDFIKPFMPDSDELDFVKASENMATVVEILINAAIEKHNYAVTAGFETGEKQEMITREFILVVIPFAELAEIANNAYYIISESFGYEIPDGVDVTVEQVDETLEEIKENRAKN